MGVDVEMKAKYADPPTDEEVAELDTAIRVVFGTDWTSHDGTLWPGIYRDRYDTAVVCLRTMSRFYGRGYERGHWPAIKSWGDWLAVALGERAQLRYGSDSGETDWEALTPWAAVRAENDPWWDEHGNEPYRAYFRPAEGGDDTPTERNDS